MSNIAHQKAFILHKQDWDDKSEQVELFTPDFGRILTFYSKQKRQLPLFQQLDIDFKKSGEFGTIKSWTADGPLHFLQEECLYFGLYLNELLVRLLPREDANPLMFGLYASTLTLISKGSSAIGALRFFERSLLKELGYAISFSVDVDQVKIDTSHYYSHLAGSGFKRVDHPKSIPSACIPGSTIVAIEQNDWSDQVTLKFARIIFQNEIDSVLDAKELHTRTLIRQYYQSKQRRILKK